MTPAGDGGRRRFGAGTPWWMAAIVVLPFVMLVVQAAGDRWQGRAIVPQEFGTRGVRSVLADPAIVEAVAGSLLVGSVVAVVAVVMAWPAARHLAATGTRLGWAVLAMPVLVPPLALGDGLSTWLLRIGIADGYTGIAVAHLAVAVPYAVLALVPAFGAELIALDHSAALAGAGPVRRATQVVLPAARHHLALSAALAFTVSWSQYATSLAVGGGTPMLPLTLVPFVRSDPQIGAALAVVFVIPPAFALAAAATQRDPARHRSGPTGRGAPAEAAVTGGSPRVSRTTVVRSGR